MSPIAKLLQVVEEADSYRVEQLALQWPELAEALAGVIEGMTEGDAPPVWWPKSAVGVISSLRLHAVSLVDVEQAPSEHWRVTRVSDSEEKP